MQASRLHVCRRAACTTRLHRGAKRTFDGGQRAMALARVALNWAARRRWRILISLLLVGLAAWLGVPHLLAWYHFPAGRAALDHYHPDEARNHFNACLPVWPHNVDTH